MITSAACARRTQLRAFLPGAHALTYAPATLNALRGATTETTVRGLPQDGWLTPAMAGVEAEGTLAQYKRDAETGEVYTKGHTATPPGMDVPAVIQDMGKGTPTCASSNMMPFQGNEQDTFSVYSARVVAMPPGLRVDVDYSDPEICRVNYYLMLTHLMTSLLVYAPTELLQGYTCTLLTSDVVSILTAKYQQTQRANIEPSPVNIRLFDVVATPTSIARLAGQLGQEAKPTVE